MGEKKGFINIYGEAVKSALGGEPGSADAESPTEAGDWVSLQCSLGGEGGRIPLHQQPC